MDAAGQPQGERAERGRRHDRQQREDDGGHRRVHAASHRPQQEVADRGERDRDQTGVDRDLAAVLLSEVVSVFGAHGREQRHEQHEEQGVDLPRMVRQGVCEIGGEMQPRRHPDQDERDPEPDGPAPRTPGAQRPADHQRGHQARASHDGLAPVRGRAPRRQQEVRPGSGDPTQGEEHPEGASVRGGRDGIHPRP